jgi:hypothetical protein
MQLTRPSIDADELAILAFARDCVEFAYRQGFEAALAELDLNPSVPWSQSLFEQLTFDHFSDGRQQKISAPSAVENLRVAAYRYNDGSGFGVDHDLPLDGKRSDFTVQLDFPKKDGRYVVYLEDIHIL